MPRVPSLIVSGKDENYLLRSPIWATYLIFLFPGVSLFLSAGALVGLTDRHSGSSENVVVAAQVESIEEWPDPMPISVLLIPLRVDILLLV